MEGSVEHSDLCKKVSCDMCAAKVTKPDDDAVVLLEL